ncbi:uncharacterized protein METZ01_LOCUS480195 [marine metagenome]|uniref:Uncharacterized protein n=1 Tax=marine metagenome TaxID=408172 RepID=A0A383C592_9ZZZZ
MAFNDVHDVLPSGLRQPSPTRPAR